MTCANCDPTLTYPGRLVRSTPNGNYCHFCGNSISHLVQHGTIMKSWDKYFHQICVSVADKSPCLSRKIGAILVKDKSIVSTGYNGPPRGIPHCGHERMMKDSTFDDPMFDLVPASVRRPRFKNECPRKVLGYTSGTHMELCPAQHAEENAVSNAARLGVSVFGSILYMNSVIPCQKCFGTLINAGITDIVVDEIKVYDKHTQFIIDNSHIAIRRFEL